MLRTLLCTAAMAITAPAMAQATMEQGSSPAAPQSATPAAPTAPAQPQGSTPAAPAQPQGATPAAPASPANSIASIVDAEFPAYDVNKDGQLDQPEFSRWMLALKDQEMKSTGNTLPADQVTAWANGAFTSADKDKSANVSKPELISYLSGGAA